TCSDEIAVFIWVYFLEGLTVDVKLACLTHYIENCLGPYLCKEEACEYDLWRKELPGLNESVPVALALSVKCLNIAQGFLFHVVLGFVCVREVWTELRAGPSADLIMSAFVVCDRG